MLFALAKRLRKHLVAPPSASVLSRFPDLLSVLFDESQIFAEAGLRVRGGLIADPITVRVSQSGHPVIFLASDEKKKKALLDFRKIVSRSKRRRRGNSVFSFPLFSFFFFFFSFLFVRIVATLTPRGFVCFPCSVSKKVSKK